MIHHTNAYLVLRTETQKTIDFVVLICHGMPALKAYMKAVEHEKAPKLPTPDYFESLRSHGELRKYITEYKKTLGNFVVLTCWAYFETYIKSVAQEIIDFHGFSSKSQTISWLDSTTSLNRRSMLNADHDTQATKKLLREPFKKAQQQRYSKHHKHLQQHGYRYPRDLLSSLGIQSIEQRLRVFRAAHIPDLLKDAFLFDLSEADNAELSRIRGIRNNIAHGQAGAVDLSAALRINEFLRNTAVSVDNHLCEHFMVIEPRD
jgi:hypothetical protein